MATMFAPIPGIQFKGYIGIDSVSVNPPVPIENTPIEISFQLTNASYGSLSGLVRFVGQHEDPKIGPSTYQVNGLAPGGSVWGKVRGLAPAAGQNQEIDLSFEPPVKGIPVLGGYKTIDVRATYRVDVYQLVCHNPRSKNQDTLIGVCSAFDDGAPLPPTNPNPQRQFEDQYGLQTESYGDHGSGSTIPVHFSFGPFDDVPGEDRDLTFTYIFSNMGGGLGAARQGLQITGHLAAAIGSAAGPIGAAIGGLIDGILQGISGILQDCNGQVASDKFRLHSGDMERITTQGQGHYEQTDSYEGNPSPGDCGEVSHYDVSWRLSRLSWWYGPV